MIVNSPLPDIEIPGTDVASFFLGVKGSEIPRFVRSSNNETPENCDSVLLVDADSGETLSYRQLLITAYGFAYKLREELGVGEGDVVAVISRPSIYLPPIHFAVLLVGGVYMPLNPHAGLDQLGLWLTQSSARLVFAQPDLLENLELGSSKHAGACISAIDEEEIRQLATSDEILDRQFRSPLFSIDNDARQSRSTTAMIAFSSGTTDAQKAVKLNHRNLISAFVQVGGYATSHHSSGLASESGMPSVLSTLPVHMLYGHCVLNYQPLYSSNRVIIAGHDESSSAAARLLATIRRHHVIRLCATPSLMYLLKAHFDVCTSSGARPAEGQAVVTTAAAAPAGFPLRYITCGGALLSPELRSAVRSNLGGAIVTQGYGLTETTSIIAGGSWVEPKPGAVGVLYPNTQAKIFDPVSGKELGPDKFGELYVRGPQVMQGYLASEPRSLAPDDFLATGDYVKVSGDGHVYIVDRVSDMIRTSQGALVAPSVIEMRLATHPEVADVAVVHLSSSDGDATSGCDTTVAFVELRPDPSSFTGSSAHQCPGERQEQEKAASEILMWYKQRLAATKLSDTELRNLWTSNELVPLLRQLDLRIQVINKVPKGPAGKILRAKLKASLAFTATPRRPADA